MHLIAATIEMYDAELDSNLALLAKLLQVAPIQEWPPIGGEHDIDAVKFFRETQLSDPTKAGWLAYYVCANGQLVGSAGFFGPALMVPPETLGSEANGVAEIGYSICLNQRSKGFATAAVGALVDIALAAGVPRLVAHVDASNLASIAVLRRNGFELGRSHREGKLGFGLRLAAMIN